MAIFCSGPSIPFLSFCSFPFGRLRFCRGLLDFKMSNRLENAILSSDDMLKRKEEDLCRRMAKLTREYNNLLRDLEQVRGAISVTAHLTGMCSKPQPSTGTHLSKQSTAKATVPAKVSRTIVPGKRGSQKEDDFEDEDDTLEKRNLRSEKNTRGANEDNDDEEYPDDYDVEEEEDGDE